MLKYFSEEAQKKRKLKKFNKRWKAAKETYGDAFTQAVQHEVLSDANRQWMSAVIAQNIVSGNFDQFVENRHRVIAKQRKELTKTRARRRGR